MTPAQRAAFDEVCVTLAHLSRLFQPEAKLSFLMRMPGNTEAEMFVSDDEPSEVIAAVERAKARPGVR